MDFDDIFEQYYTLYRAETETPASTDDEYIIARRLSSEAINRWANYDGTYWKELFTDTATTSTGATLTIATGDSTYAAPTSMREAGGYVKIKDGAVTIQNIPIIEPHEAQFKSEDAVYAYFTGNPNAGFTLHLNPAPGAELNGKTLWYMFYKKPTLVSTGTDTPEMADPYFIVNRMLAQRFRVSRNPYYTSALRDAEDCLKMMKMDNDSGSWANPWKLPDNSGSIWGE